MYAYTASQLQTAILRLFSRCECILPNLFVGVLTRESIVGALACGLSADQIVAFLRQHAHPHVASRSPVVPEVSGSRTEESVQDPRKAQETGMYPNLHSVRTCASWLEVVVRPQSNVPGMHESLRPRRRWWRTKSGCGRLTRSG